MLSAERFQDLLFDREKTGISIPVFRALAYYLSPSEPTLHQFLKSMDALSKFSTEELDKEFQDYFELVKENIAELFWQAITDSSEENITKSAIIVTIKMAEKSKNPALKYVAAHCLFENKLFKDASKMLSHIPGANIDVLIMEGMCFFHQAEYQDALSCFLNVLSLDPDEKTAKKFRCLSLVKMGRETECQDDLSILWKSERSIDLFIVFLACYLRTPSPSDGNTLPSIRTVLMEASQLSLPFDSGSLTTLLTLAFEQTEEFRRLLLGWILDQSLSPAHIPTLSNFLVEASKDGINEDVKLIQLALEKILGGNSLKI